MESRVVERFLKYVVIDTEADGAAECCPSSPGQMAFQKMLVQELNSIGLESVTLDDNGYLMATLPGNSPDGSKIPTIGFVAHVDTSPDFSGNGVNPRIIEEYDGTDIALSSDIIMSVDRFPELLDYRGDRLIVTDGTTLLGADDKAGVAEIITAIEYLKSNPEIIHGDIRICFTPDEEIGQGADLFDVEKFGAEWAYTLDGGEIGELEYANFNAASVSIKAHGVSVHPGSAKDKMVNSICIVSELIEQLPKDETPQTTEDREGFFHVMNVKGSVSESSAFIIVRDHSMEKFLERKQFLINAVEELNKEYGEGSVEIEISDSYFNMEEKIEPVKYIVDLAEAAMKSVGVTPKIKPIRGGTDGARLSFMGLPCPNIFAGGHNFHGKFEFVPTRSMSKACDVIVEIAKRVGNGDY